MTTITEALPAKKLRINDPSLPVTISRAALELDQASRGENVNLDKAEEFFNFISTAISRENSNGQFEERWLDPITVNVFSDALQVSGRAKNLRTVKDVIREALKVVDDIDKGSNKKTNQELIELRDFCVAFGNSLLTRRSRYSPQVPPHPYRK